MRNQPANNSQTNKQCNAEILCKFRFNDHIVSPLHIYENMPKRSDKKTRRERVIEPMCECGIVSARNACVEMNDATEWLGEGRALFGLDWFGLDVLHIYNGLKTPSQPSRRYRESWGMKNTHGLSQLFPVWFSATNASFIVHHAARSIPENMIYLGPHASNVIAFSAFWHCNQIERLSLIRVRTKWSEIVDCCIAVWRAAGNYIRLSIFFSTLLRLFRSWEKSSIRWFMFLPLGRSWEKSSVVPVPGVKCSNKSVRILILAPLLCAFSTA